MARCCPGGSRTRAGRAAGPTTSSGRRGRRADWNFRFDPDGLTHQHTVSVAHGLDFTHTLSKTSYYDVSVRQNYFDYKDLAYDDVYDPRYDRAGPPKATTTGYEDDAIVQGVDLTRF